MQFIEHIAQPIVEQISTIFDIPISITDKNGLIIGSTDSERLGLHHIATIEVTKSGKVMFFSKEQTAGLDNVLPGIAAPLNFQQQTIGVLGLIGEPAIVERYVQFVQAHIEMLLIERFRSKTVILQMETMRDFIQHLLSYKKDGDSKKIYSYSEMLGFSLNSPKRCILLEMPLTPNRLPSIQQSQTYTQVEQDLFLCLTNLFVDNKNDLVAPLNGNQWVILKHGTSEDVSGIKKKLDYAFNSLQTFLNNRDLISQIKLSYGDCYSTIEGIVHSYEQSSKALNIAKRNNFKESIVSIDDWSLLSHALVEDIELPARQTLDNYIERLSKHTNGAALIDSFLVYCEEQLNMSQASRRLFIHRNTLIYRLQQLQKLLDIDLESFDQCTLLYLTLKQCQYMGKLKISHN